jgi:predicted TIM-barrel fold metal-dependent hydrolase
VTPHFSVAAVVGHCNLSAANVAEVLQRQALYKRFRGIRQMLHFEPDYPQYSEAPHDNFLTNKDWIQGFGLLEQHQMSFDMCVLPSQMKR